MPLTLFKEGKTLEETHAEGAQPERQGAARGEPVSLARTFGGRSLVREIIETIILTVVVFLVLDTLTGRSQVNGSSMEPTLHSGQYLIISKVAYWIREPQRGDVVVLHPPNQPGEDYIKRIVGLPGESIEVRDGAVWVDGIRLDEPYVATAPAYRTAWDLGKGEYLVLGDNRNNSRDSHSWGVLPADNIVGKAWVSYWPPEEWGLVSHYVFESFEEGG